MGYYYAHLVGKREGEKITYLNSRGFTSDPDRAITFTSTEAWAIKDALSQYENVFKVVELGDARKEKEEEKRKKAEEEKAKEDAEFSRKQKEFWEKIKSLEEKAKREEEEEYEIDY